MTMTSMAITSRFSKRAVAVEANGVMLKDWRSSRATADCKDYCLSTCCNSYQLGE